MGDMIASGDGAGGADSPRVYTAEDIRVLTPREAIRRRPAMYVGDTSHGGLHAMLWEVVDEALDEVLAVTCGEIRLTLYRDGSASVEDDGRGLWEYERTGPPPIDLVLTQLYAPGRLRGRDR
jgi:DNA gyrase/topoisomerase IV subunit B